MGSAAYMLASQADEVVASPSSITGGIGIFNVHSSIARALEAEGIDTTLIKAGRYKAEDLPILPLGEGARDAMQTMVDVFYDQFVRAVARGRGATARGVKKAFGEGRALAADAALEAGLADKVETLADVVVRLGTSRGRNAIARSSHAEDEEPDLVAAASVVLGPLEALSDKSRHRGEVETKSPEAAQLVEQFAAPFLEEIA